MPQAVQNPCASTSSGPAPHVVQPPVLPAGDRLASVSATRSEPHASQNLSSVGAPVPQTGQCILHLVPCLEERSRTHAIGFIDEADFFRPDAQMGHGAKRVF